MSKMIVPPVTYKLSPGGVKRSDGACIPNCTGNRDWKKYQEWLAEGNTPDPEFTQEEIDAQSMSTEIADLKADLKKAQVWQFRMIIEIWKVLKMHTSAVNSDVDPDVLAKAQSWVAKLDRLKEIDE